MTSENEQSLGDPSLPSLIGISRFGHWPSIRCVEQGTDVAVEYRVMPPILTTIGCVLMPAVFSMFAWFLLPQFIAGKTPYTALFRALYLYVPPGSVVFFVLFFFACVAQQILLRRGGPILKYDSGSDCFVVRYDRCSIPKQDVLRVMSVINHRYYRYYHEIQIEARTDEGGSRLVFVGKWAHYNMGVRRIFARFCSASNLEFERHGVGLGFAASE